MPDLYSVLSQMVGKPPKPPKQVAGTLPFRPNPGWVDRTVADQRAMSNSPAAWTGSRLLGQQGVLWPLDEKYHAFDAPAGQPASTGMPAEQTPASAAVTAPNGVTPPTVQQPAPVTIKLDDIVGIPVEQFDGKTYLTQMFARALQPLPSESAEQHAKRVRKFQSLMQGLEGLPEISRAQAEQFFTDWYSQVMPTPDYSRYSDREQSLIAAMQGSIPTTPKPTTFADLDKTEVAVDAGMALARLLRGGGLEGAAQPFARSFERTDAENRQRYNDQFARAQLNQRALGDQLDAVQSERRDMRLLDAQQIKAVGEDQSDIRTTADKNATDLEKRKSATRNLYTREIGKADDASTRMGLVAAYLRDMRGFDPKFRLSDDELRLYGIATPKEMAERAKAGRDQVYAQREWNKLLGTDPETAARIKKLESGTAKDKQMVENLKAVLPYLADAERAKIFRAYAGATGGSGSGGESPGATRAAINASLKVDKYNIDQYLAGLYNEGMNEVHIQKVLALAQKWAEGWRPTNESFWDQLGAAAVGNHVEALGKFIRLQKQHMEMLNEQGGVGSGP